MKAAFLDIDNTILDFDEYVRQTMKSGFSHFNLNPYEDYMFNIFNEENNKLWHQIEKGELTFEELRKNRWNIIFSKIGICFDGTIFEKYFREALMDSAIVINGAEEMLIALRKKNIIICAASNGPYNQQLHRLEIAGLKKYFDYFFISEKLGCSKPSSEFFIKAFSEINLKGKIDINLRECIILGDSLTSDIAGGKMAGMKACYYNYGNKEIEDNELIDYVCNDLREFVNLF